MSANHYERLGVSHSAPPEIITAAWRSLARTYHPDLNPGDEAAAQAMAAVNEAYAILSDPEKRRDYDRALRTTAPPPIMMMPDALPERSAFHQPIDASRFGWPLAVGVLLLAGVGTGYVLLNQPEAAAPIPQAELAPAQAAASTAAEGRPAGAAPNGLPWPTEPGYLPGYAQLKVGGQGSITIDNAAFGSGVYLQLIALPEGIVSRHVFVPGGRTFRIGEVAPGRYGMNFVDLADQQPSSSEAFGVTDSSNLTMTLGR